jgi:hypothetical protein
LWCPVWPCDGQDQVGLSAFVAFMSYPAVVNRGEGICTVLGGLDVENEGVVSSEGRAYPTVTMWTTIVRVTKMLLRLGSSRILRHLPQPQLPGSAARSPSLALSSDEEYSFLALDVWENRVLRECRDCSSASCFCKRLSSRDWRLYADRVPITTGSGTACGSGSYSIIGST